MTAVLSPEVSCFMSVCFAPLDSTTPKLFGFGEFLASLALMVLAWTIADSRYRFRVRTAPIPLYSTTYFGVIIVGLLSLATDVWIAESWLVPIGRILTPATWQALLAALFFTMFLAWSWFAFISPPTFGPQNAARFARTVYFDVLGGSRGDLSVIVDELVRSIPSIVKYAAKRERQDGNPKIEKLQGNAALASQLASDLLLLLGDRRVCRIIVGSVPILVLVLFEEIKKLNGKKVNIEILAKNLIHEALSNTDSFLYHESDGYNSGLLGYHQPLSNAIFSDFRLVEQIGTLLDIDFRVRRNSVASQWETYCRLTKIVLLSYVKQEFWNHSFVLYRAKGEIADAVSDLYKLNGRSTPWDDDARERLRVCVDFVKDAVEILEQSGLSSKVRLRVRDNSPFYNTTFFDHLADLIFEIILSAAAVRSPRDECWTTQRNMVWAEFFNFNAMDSSAGKIIKFKVRRLLYDEIKDICRFPNYKNSKILGFCLNVMGATLDDQNYSRDSRPLHKAMLRWLKANFAWLYAEHPLIAKECLVEGFAFDAANREIIRTYPADAFRKDDEHVKLKVDAPR